MDLEEQVPGGAEASRTTYKRRPHLAVPDDGGRTFSEAVDMAGALDESLTQPSLAIGNDGTVHSFFGETQVTEFGEDVREGHLFYARSTDGGKTFSQKLVHTQAPGIEFTYLNTPSTVVNRRNGEVYVAWEETGSETSKVLFMASADDGQTWSAPVKLNDVDPARTWDFQEFNPWISVAPNGRIDAAWYDWRDDVTFAPGPEAEYALQHVYATSSEDEGRTWSPNVRVTDRAIDRRSSDVWQNGVHGPEGLASTDERSYIAWDDPRNAIGESSAQHVYFTRLHHQPGGLLAESSTKGAMGTKVLWSVLGLAVGLGLAGMALLASRAASDDRRATPA